MATPAQNPFDTQPQKPTNQGAAGTAAPAQQKPAAQVSPQKPGSSGIVGGAMNGAQTYQPTTRAVDKKTETVQGQVDSILAKDGPLMQRARSIALEQANQRGLVNSSLAVGAGQLAMLESAIPMAQQDANTYVQAAQGNVDAKNQAGQFNANQNNEFTLQKNEQTYQTAERQRDFEYQTKLQTQQAEAELKRLGYQASLTDKNVPQQFAAGVAGTTMDKINSILADPNINNSTIQPNGKTAKQNAIDNVVKMANATMAWAEKFYNVQLPDLAQPATTTAPAPTTGKPSSAPAPGRTPAPAPAPRPGLPVQR